MSPICIELLLMQFIAYKNADDIVLFLSSINPYLSKDAFEVFDEIEAEVFAMSDMIASAIVMQFFNRFRCP